MAFGKLLGFDLYVLDYHGLDLLAVNGLLVALELRQYCQNYGAILKVRRHLSDLHSREVRAPLHQRHAEVSLQNGLALVVHFYLLRVLLLRIDGQHQVDLVRVLHNLVALVSQLQAQLKNPISVQGRLQVLHQHQLVVVLLVEQLA